MPSSLNWLITKLSTTEPVEPLPSTRPLTPLPAEPPEIWISGARRNRARIPLDGDLLCDGWQGGAWREREIGRRQTRETDGI